MSHVGEDMSCLDSLELFLVGSLSAREGVASCQGPRPESRGSPKFKGDSPLSSVRRRLAVLILLPVIATGILNGNDKGVRLPHLEAMRPIGGQAGSQVEVALLGDMLSNAESVEFDCDDLDFTLTKATAERIEGTIRISKHAPLGQHILRAKTKDGYTTALWFTVGQFEPVPEQEPNETLAGAQAISPPCEIYGTMEKKERDFYAIKAKKGDRWIFEVRSIQFGSMFESYLNLRDETGRELVFNDDRADFDVNSLIDHTFEKDGTHFIEVDSFRGVRGWGFTKNNGYVLRVSRVPLIDHVSPLGGRAGSRVTVRFSGRGLQQVEQVYLSPTRRGEHVTLTIPWTMDVRFADDYSTASEIPRVEGKILRRASEAMEVEFDLPVKPLGTWSLFVKDKSGIADPKYFEVTQAEEVAETESNDRHDEPQELPFSAGKNLVVNGRLERREVTELSQDKDFYALDAKQGVSLRIHTNAYQLLSPSIDTVVSLFDTDGKLLAESDDLTHGRGFYTGSVDSNLYYIPERDQKLVISVSDRVGRGGPGYDYRLHVKSEEPGFLLIVSPQFGLQSISLSNFTVEQGGESNMVVGMIRMPPQIHSDDPAPAALAPPPGAVMKGEVRVWVEGLPPGVTAEEHLFRADEIVEPGGDGATFMVPERLLTIRAGDAVPPGTYPFRVLGEVVGNEGVTAVGRAMDSMGGITELYNFPGRPVAETALTVIEPGAVTVELDAKEDKVVVMQGETSLVGIKNRLPVGAGDKPSVWLTNAPEGVSAHLDSDPEGNLLVGFRAAEETGIESTENVYVEFDVGRRVVSSHRFTVQVVAREHMP